MQMRLPASLDSRLQSFLTPWTDKLLKTCLIHNQSHGINNQMSVIDGCLMDTVHEEMSLFTTNNNISRPPCESHQESVGEPRSQSGRLHDHLQRHQVVNTHISDNKNLANIKRTFKIDNLKTSFFVVENLGLSASNTLFTSGNTPPNVLLRLPGVVMF